MVSDEPTSTTTRGTRRSVLVPLAASIVVVAVVLLAVALFGDDASAPAVDGAGDLAATADREPVDGPGADGDGADGPGAGAGAGAHDDDHDGDHDHDHDAVDERPTAGFDPQLEAVEVGDTAPLADQAQARVRSVAADVEPTPGSPQPAPGITLYRADVELCTGAQERYVDAAFWLALDDRGVVHSPHMGVRDLVAMTMVPGTCQRGTVDLAVPEEVRLDAILLTATDREAVARWVVDDAGLEGPDEEPGASADAPQPLEPVTEPERSGSIGEQVTPLNEGTAVVHDLDDPDAPDGSDGAAATRERRVRLDVERCPAHGPVPWGARSWFVQLDDHRLVAADPGSSTLDEGELAPDTCGRGTVEVTVPAASELAAVVLTYGGAFEEARWTLTPADG